MRDLWVEAMPARVVNVLVLQLLISTTVLALWAREWLPALSGRLRCLAQAPALTGLALLVLLSGQARLAWPELLGMAPAYSQQMQARYEMLAAAHRQGAAEAVVPPVRLPWAMGLLAPIASARQQADVHVELHPDYNQKNNLFLAHYYGIPRVRLAVPAPGNQ